MHSTGCFIKDKRSFSEKHWGHRTAIYSELATDPTPSQWNKFYASLRVNSGFQDKLNKCSWPMMDQTDNPQHYFIAGSDPADGDDTNDVDDIDNASDFGGNTGTNSTADDTIKTDTE